MQVADLYRLISAIDMGDARPYHGDIREGLLEALNELVEVKETLESVEGDAPTVCQAVESYEKLHQVKQLLQEET